MWTSVPEYKASFVYSELLPTVAQKREISKHWGLWDLCMCLVWIVEGFAVLTAVLTMPFRHQLCLTPSPYAAASPHSGVQERRQEVPLVKRLFSWHGWLCGSDQDWAPRHSLSCEPHSAVWMVPAVCSCDLRTCSAIYTNQSKSLREDNSFKWHVTVLVSSGNVSCFKAPIAVVVGFVVVVVVGFVIDVCCCRHWCWCCCSCCCWCFCCWLCCCCVVYRVSFLCGILCPQFGVKVQLSSHQLTKIITLSPFFLLENQTKVGVVL